MERTLVSRRAVILGGSSAVAAVVTGIWATNRRPESVVRPVRVALPRVAQPLPPAPLDPARAVTGLSPLMTPNADFYRIDISADIPMPSPAAWSLSVDGMVRRPLTFTYDELAAREVIEVDATLACVSNWVGGPLVGNARWTGVRLDSLLAEAEPTPRADEVLGHSVDGFTAGFPLDVLDGRPAIVALGMNGEALPPEHGFPARILVPGLYGYVSAVKWLARIELTRFDEQVGYWIPRGWAERAAMKLSSRIDTPRDGESSRAGSKQIAGIAWSSNVGIATVEVQVDGDPWRSATLGPQLARTTWRQWWLDWEAPQGDHWITVRAIDEAGQRQSTAQVDAMPNGAEGLHSVRVFIS